MKIQDLAPNELEKIKKEDIYMELFNFSRPTYYKWKREETPALLLIEQYFTNNDLIDYLKNKKVKRYDEQVSITFQNFLVENSLYEAKRKYKIIFESSGLDFLNNYGSKEILKEILPNVTNYTIETAKEKLFEHIKGYETKKFGIPKNTGKKELLSKYIQRSFTTTEIYAMLENQETFFDLGYIF